MRLRLAAPAKLNLYLHVLGRRRDGFHRLDSLVAFAEVHDLVEVAEADALRLEIAGEEAGSLATESPERNLVFRAAVALAKAAGMAPRGHIRLDKRLPVAAGLGGGSADAAAALRLFDRLWGLGMAEKDLLAIGRGLGADVPMCVLGQACRARGVGERLSLVAPPPPAPVVLVNPGRPLPTAAVFKAHRASWSRAGRTPTPDRDPVVFAARLARRRNDLTMASASLAPEIADILAELATAGAMLARMSGSGATCFGLFADEAGADAATRFIAGRHPSWWVRATRLATARPRIEVVA